jgi:glycosidase
MATPRHPSLYQLNTRILLREVGDTLGRPATLDDVPDALLDRVAADGFDWVWFLGVWQTGAQSRTVSLANTAMRAELLRLLPDLKDEDVSGSPFAIRNYVPHEDFGGREALARLRERLARRGLKLLLDFVPNHMALDHPWRFARPEFFVLGSEEDLTRQPQNYIKLLSRTGPTVFAHGRDPYFDGWPDVLQLNYRHAGLRVAMRDTLLQISEMCDGVRCDMAMLVMPHVFAQTWGARAWPADGSDPEDTPFWPEAIQGVHAARPHFVFMAEVYWDLEWELQQQGFDYTYDKRLYDRLHARQAEAVRLHLCADLEFQRKSVRFLENHDEPRAASVFPWDVHRAASVVTFLVPGLRFFHEGQFEGRQVHVSMHLGRRPGEPADPAVARHYRALLEVLKRPETRDGTWSLRDCRPAYGDNSSWNNFIAFTWEGDAGRLLVVVNYADLEGQCTVNLGLPGLEGKSVRLQDLLGGPSFDRDGSELAVNGLHVVLPRWGYHVFEVQTA